MPTAADVRPLASEAGAAPLLELPAYVVRQPSGFYRSLNPSTKVAIAVFEAVAVFVVPGWLGPLSVLAAILVVGLLAGVVRSLAVIAVAAAPLYLSILVVNLFLLPGATDAIVHIGPLAPTWSGLNFGAQAAARVLALSYALAFVYLVTAIDDLLADLERRGLGRRPVFVIGAAVQMVPRTIERAEEIVEAQRARGMDTEGRFWRRARGILPLAAPVIFGALTEVEERTMALEARAFTAPVRRTMLRVPDIKPFDRVLMWLAFAALVAVIALRVTGRLG